MMIAALLLLQPQDLFPVDQHPWLRYAKGTWIRYGVTVEAKEGKNEASMTRTLEASDGSQFTVTTDHGGGSPRESETFKRPRKTGSENVRVLGRDVPCVVWTSEGKRGDSSIEARFWVPEGEKHPYKILVKEPDRTFEALLEGTDSKVHVKGTAYACAKLSGRVTTPQGESKVAMWLNPELPGGQPRIEVTHPSPDGPVRVVMAAVEFEERK